MRRFTNEQIISTVKRLSSYSGGKSSQATVATNLNGYLRPLSEEQSAINSLQWGQGFTLITEIGVDIKVGDVLTIASTDYTVRGKADHNRGTLTAYLKFLLVKPQK